MALSATAGRVPLTRSVLSDSARQAIRAASRRIFNRKGPEEQGLGLAPLRARFVGPRYLDSQPIRVENMGFKDYADSEAVEKAEVELGLNAQGISTRDDGKHKPIRDEVMRTRMTRDMEEEGFLKETTYSMPDTVEEIRQDMMDAGTEEVEIMRAAAERYRHLGAAAAPPAEAAKADAAEQAPEEDK